MEDSGDRNTLVILIKHESREYTGNIFAVVNSKAAILIIKYFFKKLRQLP